MSTYETSYKSLLQGVSQQLPTERLPGQVQFQQNMLSDVVTNVRRRAGALHLFGLNVPAAGYGDVLAWHTDIAGKSVHVILNITNGDIKLVDDTFSTVSTLEGGAYLTTADRKNIRAATVGDELYLCNVAIKPAYTTSTGVDPSKHGFFYIAAGAFNKQYKVTLSTGTGTVSATYTTPSGAGTGDAANSTPEYIATQLVSGLASGLAAAGITSTVRDGAYVYVTSTGTNLTVNSSTGIAYVITSRDSYVSLEGQLPAMLPSNADGYIVRVGAVTLPTYYKYVHATRSWEECGAYGSPDELTNMPVAVTHNGTTWEIIEGGWEGRLSGDDDSNPLPRFLTHGITGMCTYQGRLGLLSGHMVKLSASRKPQRMFRSTVTSLRDDDPIEVGASANSSASYEYAVQFQKDLVLFSSKYQAIIPSSNTTLTPRNATVVLTSTHEADMSCEPASIGRTLLYSIPRSAAFFGMFEMIQSPYTDSQFVSQDVTGHLPKYFSGRARFISSSSVSGIALVAPSGNTKALLVHEYMWSGDEKVQQAWHMWTFKYDVASAYFWNDRVYVLFVHGGKAMMCGIDPRQSMLTSAAAVRPFLDFAEEAVVANRTVTVPSTLSAFDPDIASSLVLTVATGGNAGEVIGHEVVDSTTLRTHRSFQSGEVFVGVPFYSGITPTPPVVRDYNGVPITTGKFTVLRYTVGLRNSSPFDITIRDANMSAYDWDHSTLYYSSPDLDAGAGQDSEYSTVTVPARTDAHSTELTLSTSGTGDLNITSLEYVAKFNTKIKRR